MQKLIALLIILGLSAGVNAQKVINDPNVEARTVRSFQGVSVSGGIDLYLSYGDEAVAVSASKTEYRDRIKTEVENGVLKIYYDHKNGISFGGDRRLKAYVSYKTLNKLSASGGSDISVDGTIKSSQLKFDFSGGSDFKGSIDVSELDVDQSGGSDVDIKGMASRLKIDASGGSDFNGYDLVTEVCNIHASGGSDVEITATRELSAQASGASDISYKGKPVVKQVKASGASSVSQRGK
jgi:hypothetical protein